ncbi:hypothetical protein C8R42DRAFT_643873 [Lentinula raphanica]|nr:hypothetical protein C8R42DRAFT_643873 [Lentinula raphanica]
MSVEDAEESLDDGELEFEDDGEIEYKDEGLEDEDLEDPAEEEALPPVQTPHEPYTPAFSRSRKRKQYSILTGRSRAARAIAARERISNLNVKPLVVELATKAQPLVLEDFNSSSLPVSNAGWNANPRKRLSPGLEKVWKDLKALSSLSGQKLLEWDGECMLKNGSIPFWAAFLVALEVQSDKLLKLKLLQPFYQHLHEGSTARTTGFGYGNRRAKPQNFRVVDKANQEAVQELLQNKALRRISGFHNSREAARASRWKLEISAEVTGRVPFGLRLVGY